MSYRRHTKTFIPTLAAHVQAITQLCLAGILLTVALKNGTNESWPLLWQHLSVYLDYRSKISSLNAALLSAGWPDSNDAGDYQSHTFCKILVAECTETLQDLWICLICGHVGCGRYRAGHSQDHWRESSHVYALELETQRVWDYVGDGYVHRLIQSKTDGKLVEVPPPATSSRGHLASACNECALAILQNWHKPLLGKKTPGALQDTFLREEKKGGLPREG